MTGLNNFKFRDYLGPLSKYTRPSMLLPDLKSASHLLQDKVHHKDNKDPNKKNQTSQKASSVKICFNCKGEGHTANQCEKPRSNVCFKCNATGHYAKYCTSTGTSETVSKSRNVSGQMLHIETSRSHSKYFKELFEMVIIWDVTLIWVVPALHYVEMLRRKQDLLILKGLLID